MKGGPKTGRGQGDFTNFSHKIQNCGFMIGFLIIKEKSIPKVVEG
jgi:hypothetical protein